MKLAKERHQIKSECPECGCGLIDNMTPDEYRKKHGVIRENETVNSNDGGHAHDGGVPEKPHAD